MKTQSTRGKNFKIYTMKKIITLVAVALLTINLSAQEVKSGAKDSAKKESCCAKKDSKSKGMTAAEMEQCKTKCKAEGKKCDATKAKASGKKC